MGTRELTVARIAENQSTFRAANEKIEDAAAEFDVVGVLPFICECPDPMCTEIVRLGAADYEEIRRDPRHFFSAPGHEVVSVETGAGAVVEERAGYTLVEKVGTAGEIAAERRANG
jgi:hypothetical protein